MVSPETCTSLNVIIVPAARERAAAIAADAARLARAGGHLASVPRLEELGGIR